MVRPWAISFVETRELGGYRSARSGTDATPPLNSAHICSLSVPGGDRDAWRGSILWLARHRAVRARQARRHEVDQGVRLSRRARHGDAGMDTREKLPPLAPGNAAALPDVRLARRATDLRRAARSADGSWRKVGAEVKASRLGNRLGAIPLNRARSSRSATPWETSRSRETIGRSGRGSNGQNDVISYVATPSMPNYLFSAGLPPPPATCPTKTTRPGQGTFNQTRVSTTTKP